MFPPSDWQAVLIKSHVEIHRRGPVRVVGGVGFGWWGRVSPAQRHGDGGNLHAVGGSRAADPGDAQGGAAIVQDGRESRAQGVRPRQAVRRPSVADHWQGAGAVGGCHCRAAAHQYRERHHVGHHVLVGHR